MLRRGNFSLCRTLRGMYEAEFRPYLLNTSHLDGLARGHRMDEVVMMKWVRERKPWLFYLAAVLIGTAIALAVYAMSCAASISWQGIELRLTRSCFAAGGQSVERTFDRPAQ